MKVWSVVADIGTENAHVRAVLLFQPDTPFLERHFRTDLPDEQRLWLGYTTLDVVESRLDVPELRMMVMTNKETDEEPFEVKDFMSDLPEVDNRDKTCVERWPECRSFEYDPRCCRFPKNCSAGYR